MAVVAILECNFKPEHVDAGIRWLQKTLVATRAFEGCLDLEVFQDRDDPSRFVVVEHWASLEHDSTYRAWREGEGRVTEGRELFAGPPKLTVGVVRADI
jgi:quinol monooxygenase YgiN